MQDSPPPIRLLLVDDHVLFRESLGRLLHHEPGFVVVAQSATTPEAIEVLQEYAVDVVLLDYDLGGERGAALLEALQRIPFAGRVLMVTAGMTEHELAQVLQQGVAGVFLKHNSPAQLALAIRHVMTGEAWLDQRSIAALAQAAERASREVTEPAFTERERLVLRGVFEGSLNKDIAAQLGLSESVVKATLQTLFERTGVRSRGQLVRVALEQFQGRW